MSVRIIGGEWKGRRLECPPGTTTRPLLDRIKQSLFDSLGQRLDGQRVVDCCAGSGSFGLEAASRGAAEVHLIECDRSALACLMANLRSLGTAAPVQIHNGDFAAVLPGLGRFDLVFCDPPFPWFRDQPAALDGLLDAAAAAVTADGLVLLRGERGQQLPSLPPTLIADKQRRYGRSWVSFLRPA